jgi:hypothetical protein
MGMSELWEDYLSSFVHWSGDLDISYQSDRFFEHVMIKQQLCRQ